LNAEYACSIRVFLSAIQPPDCYALGVRLSRRF
jgi:hypothetical protein